MPFCPECGKEISIDEKFCYSCGATITRHLTSSFPSENERVKIAAGVPEISANIREEETETQASVLTEEEQNAIHKLKLFALIELFSFSIVFILVPVLSYLKGLNPVSLPSSLSSNVSLSALLAIAFGVGIFSVLQARQAFAYLSDVDYKQFSPISQSTVALITGLFLFFILEVVYIATSKSHNLVSSTDFSIAMMAVFVIGFFPWLAGVLYLATGFWRLGKRYGNGYLKTAALLQVIPYACLCSTTLVFGALSQDLTVKHEEMRNVQSYTTTPSPAPVFQNTLPSKGNNYGLIAVGAVFFVVGIMLFLIGYSETSTIVGYWGAYPASTHGADFELVGGLLGFIGLCLMIVGLGEL